MWQRCIASSLCHPRTQVADLAAPPTAPPHCHPSSRYATRSAALTPMLQHHSTSCSRTPSRIPPPPPPPTSISHAAWSPLTCVPSALEDP
eukprot:365411-Chlamydomonas_euryale.AAC.1